MSDKEKILRNVNVIVREVKGENSSLPVAVRVLKTRVLKISINGHWVRSGYEFYHFRHQRPRYFCTAPMITTPHFTAVKQLGTRAIYALPVTSGHFPVSSHKISAVNLLHSNHLCTTVPIILPLQTFFSRVLLLRQQAFLSGNLAPESYSNKQHFHVSLRTRKFDKKNSLLCRDSFFVEEDI